MKKLLLSIVGILTVVSLSSQTILPQQTKIGDQNAVIISESQMDSINILFLKHKLLKTENSSWKIKLQQANTRIEAFILELNSLQGITQDYKRIIINNDKQRSLLERKHSLAIEFYKKKSKNKWIPYVIGFVAGGITAVVL